MLRCRWKSAELIFSPCTNERRWNTTQTTCRITMKISPHLDFRAFPRSSYQSTALTTPPGRSVLRCQLRLRHRRPVETRIRFHRTVRSLPPSDPSHPKPIHRFRRRSRYPHSVEGTPRRDHHDPRPSVCQPSDVTAGRTHRNVGQAVAQPVPLTHRGATTVERCGDRQPTREIAVPFLHRKSPRHASDRPPSPRLRHFAVHVVDQHVCCTGHHLPHCSRLG